MFPNWGHGEEEPQSVKVGNHGLYRPQVICSFQGLSQHLLVPTGQWVWQKKECQYAFEKLKIKLLDSPALGLIWKSLLNFMFRRLKELP